jgi:hypothetical protein
MLDWEEVTDIVAQLYEMEKLYGSMHDAYTLAALEYNGVGDAWTAVKYARLGLEFALPMLGEGDEHVDALRQFVRDPRGHWTWRKRVMGEEKKKVEEN